MRLRARLCAHAAIAIYLSSLRLACEEIKTLFASGECEKNAHALRVRCSMTLPPGPPTSMLVAFKVSFTVRKKTLTFATHGYFTYAPTLKWGVRGASAADAKLIRMSVFFRTHWNAINPSYSGETVATVVFRPEGKSTSSVSLG